MGFQDIVAECPILSAISLSITDPSLILPRNVTASMPSVLAMRGEYVDYLGKYLTDIVIDPSQEPAFTVRRRAQRRLANLQTGAAMHNRTLFAAGRGRKPRRPPWFVSGPCPAG